MSKSKIILIIILILISSAYWFFSSSGARAKEEVKKAHVDEFMPVALIGLYMSELEAQNQIPGPSFQQFCHEGVDDWTKCIEYCAPSAALKKYMLLSYQKTRDYADFVLSSNDFLLGLSKYIDVMGWREKVRYTVAWVDFGLAALGAYNRSADAEYVQYVINRSKRTRQEVIAEMFPPDINIKISNGAEPLANADFEAEYNALCAQDKILFQQYMDAEDYVNAAIIAGVCGEFL